MQSLLTPNHGEIMATVYFKKSGIEAEWDSSCDNLLELAEKNNLDLDFGCRQGNCTACQQNIIEGEVHYPDGHSGIPDEGNQLLCCSVPHSKRVVIDA